MATPPVPPSPPPSDLPPPGGSPAVAWSVPPSSAPLPARRRAPIYVGIAAAVVVVVVVLVLALHGILPFFKSPSPGGSSFADARGPAQATANGYPGGPWTLVLAGGLALHATTNVSALNRSLGALPSNCNLSGTPPMPPTSFQGVGNVSQGLASEWAFMFRNSTGALLAVTDIAGSYQIQGAVSGTGCSSPFGGASPPIPSNVVDSTTAAKAADTAGGYAFLQAHPQANGTLGIIGGATVLGFTLGAEWAVIYSACPFVNAAPISDPVFTAVVNATTGMVVQSTTSTMACGVTATGAKTPLGTVLAMSSPTEMAKGARYWYNFTVQAAGGGLTWGNTALQVQTSSGVNVPLASSSTLNVISLTGSVVGTFSFVSATWVLGSSLAVTNTQEVSLSTPSSTSLSGDVLVVSGTGAFSGSVHVSIP